MCLTNVDLIAKAIHDKNEKKQQQHLHHQHLLFLTAATATTTATATATATTTTTTSTRTTSIFQDHNSHHSNAVFWCSKVALSWLEMATTNHFAESWKPLISH